MGSVLVEEAEVGLKPCLQISNAVVGVQINMLVLHRAPEPFDCSLPRQLDTPMGDISAGLGCCQF